MEYRQMMDDSMARMYKKWPIIKPPEYIPATIGGRIKAARLKAGMTPTLLKGTMGSDVRTINKWETGEQIPSVYRTLKLAEAIGCTIDYLLGCSLEERLSTVGERMRFAREEAGVSHEAICKALKKDKAIVPNIETGRTLPTDDQLRVIAGMLEVSVAWLKGEE